MCHEDWLSVLVQNCPVFAESMPKEICNLSQAASYEKSGRCCASGLSHCVNCFCKTCNDSEFASHGSCACPLDLEGQRCLRRRWLYRKASQLSFAAPKVPESLASSRILAKRPLVQYSQDSRTVHLRTVRLEIWLHDSASMLQEEPRQLPHAKLSCTSVKKAHRW